jgi:Holliday junction resolvase RusA-like endonuclease
MQFFASGIPAPQGSKTKWGTEASKNLKPWRDTVIIAARNAENQQVYFGPVAIDLTFFFPRPKSHYGTGMNATLLKARAPEWKASAPDLDKLCRAVLDGLVHSGILRDDALVVTLNAGKLYDVTPGCRVTIRPVS